MSKENEIPPRPLHVFHFHGNANVSFWNSAQTSQNFHGNEPAFHPAAPAKGKADNSCFLAIAGAIAAQNIPDATKWKLLCECFPELKEAAKN